MKKRVCDLCGSGILISGFKVKSDGCGWYKKIDICRRCWDILGIALDAKDKGVEIKHKGLYSEIVPKQE